jgi:hypothetical protein
LDTEDETTIKECVNQKKEEELVVVEPNTVVDPRAMMVHLQDASTASRAMMGAVGFPILAFVTESHASILFNLQSYPHTTTMTLDFLLPHMNMLRLFHQPSRMGIIFRNSDLNI